MGIAPTSVGTDPVFETGAASLYLPAFQKCGIRNAECEMKSSRTPGCLVPRSAFHTPRSKWLPDLDSHQDKRFNRRRAALTPPGNGAAGRNSTCIVPLRRRMLDVFDHGSNLKWSARQDLHLRSLGPRPSVLLLHYALMADLKGLAPSAFPQTTGCSSN